MRPVVEHVLRCLLPALVVLATAVPAHAQSRAREGAALFTPPTGWARVTDADGTRYVSPDKTVSVTFGRAIAYTGSLATPLETVLAEAKKLQQYRVEERQQGGTHDASGGSWIGALYTYADTSRNAFAYVWLTVVGAGGRAVPVTATFADHATFKGQSATILKMMNAISLTTTEVLETGTPPLTRYAVDETTDFVEWLMETPLTVDQRRILETELRGSWRARDKDEIDGIVELLGARDQLAALEPAERDLARQAVIAEGLKEWRKDKKSASAKMLVGIYDASHTPIAKGTPPLTRQGVDAFVEFLYFAATQAAGAPEVSPPDAIKAQLAKSVAKGYAKMSKDQRELIAQMPIIWASLRAGWADLPAADKAQYIDGWKRAPVLVQLGTALNPATQATRTAQAQPAGRQGTKATNAAAMQQEAMRNQMALQAQQQHFQMMQQMMRQQFESQMMMNSNLGGNTSYSYRW